MDASENTGPTQVSTTTVLIVLATLFVCLRFWARWNVAARYGLDDYLIVAGLVSTLPMASCALAHDESYCRSTLAGYWVDV